MSMAARPKITVLAGGRDDTPPGGGTGSGGGASVPDDWRTDLLRTGDGACKATAGNLQLILRNDPAIAGVFRYNEFTSRVDVVGVIPGPVSLPAGPLADQHLAALGAWLSRGDTYRLSARPQQIAEAVSLAAHEHAFHPVRDYFDALAWDGKERLAGALNTYLGAAAGPYSQRVSCMLFVAVVARVFKPGCKVDFVVILESLHQGVGKSTMVRNLINPDWYVESIETMGGREFLMSIRGALIVELGELSVLSRADYNRVKQAITAQIDTYRDPFARCVASYPRQCVFVGTTNQDDWNRDPSGARRFLPVRVIAADLESFLHDRDQLWAEAVHLYQQGFDYWTLPDAAEAEQDDRFDDDIWQEPIANWLDGRAGDGTYPVTIDMLPADQGRGVRSATPHQLMTCALGVDLPKQSRADWMRVAAIMRRLGWPKERVQRGSTRSYRYLRPLGSASDVPF